MTKKAHRDKKRKIRVLLTGGGTGGHVYPNLALLDILRQEFDIEDVLYVGSRGRGEETIVPRAGLPIRYVSCAPMSGLNPLKAFGALGRVAAGTIQAARILLSYRPNLIVAAGGYVSAPLTFASFLLRPFRKTRLVIQEQNVVPGLMNKVASLFAHVVMVSFPETPFYIWTNRCVFTGYPVRQEFEKPVAHGAARERVGVPADRLLVLVYGGSMGARSLNRLLVDTLPRMARMGRPMTVIHASGLAAGAYNAFEDTRQRLRKSLPPDATLEEREGNPVARLAGGHIEYRLFPYLHELSHWLAASDLVICRAGAGAVSELLAMGKPALVVPKRDLPGDHQELNAISLAEKGACEIVFERRNRDGIDYVDGGEFASVFESLAKEPARMAALGAKARNQFQSSFRSRMVHTIRQVLAGKDPEFLMDFGEPVYVRMQKQVDTLVDFLRKEPSDSFYRRFYRIKMEEAFQSSRWERLNQGIKLCGALQRTDQIPLLLSLFETGNGFMRRNILTALMHMDQYDPAFADLVQKALEDPYFEVRSHAARLVSHYIEDLGKAPGVREALLKRVGRRFERFEVRGHCLRVLALLLPLSDFFALADPFRFARNVRLREAVLDGIGAALEAGLVPSSQIGEVRQFVREILITTSGFRPRFSIRERYVDLYQKLAE